MSALNFVAGCVVAFGLTFFTAMLVMSVFAAMLEPSLPIPSP